MKRASGWVVALVATMACAEIKTSSKVEIVPKQGAQAVVIGPPDGALTARGVRASWQQDGASLQLELQVTRTCAELRHHPVVRIERITRNGGGALYWEFGIGAALLAGGLTALIRPDLFSQSSIAVDGETTKDLRAGYRIGGIFTALSAVALTAGTYDAVRSRDEVRYHDAFRVQVGDPVACRQPLRPVAERDVELIVGEQRLVATTDADGRARFDLPDPAKLPSIEAPELPPGLPDTAMAALAAGGFFDPLRFVDAVAPAMPRRVVVTTVDGEPRLTVEPRTVVGVVRIGDRALTVDFVEPYDAESAREHTGTSLIDPRPVRARQPTP